MEDVLGYLKIRVKRGINLARRDLFGSDPYVVVNMGQQKLKTHTVQKNCNPVWNQELLLSIKDPNEAVLLKVYDKDIFTSHDEMGEAEIDIKPFLQVVKNGSPQPQPPLATHFNTLSPNTHNCLAKHSAIRVWENGKVTQDMTVRLRNVESGEVELQLEWVNAPGCRGFCVRGRFACGFQSAARVIQLQDSHRVNAKGSHKQDAQLYA